MCYMQRQVKAVHDVNRYRCNRQVEHAVDVLLDIAASIVYAAVAAATATVSAFVVSG